MRRLLTAVERYVLAQTLVAIGGAMAVLSSVILLIDFVDVAGRVDKPFTGVAALVAMKSPAVIVLVLPFMLLFGAMAALGGLHRRSELIALRAAGVSAWRFIMPAALTAFLFGVVTVTVLDPITTDLNARYIETMVSLKADPAARKGSDVWLRQGGEGKRNRIQTVIHATSMDASSPGVRLNDVSFFEFELAGGGVATFQRRIDAQSAVLTAGAWQLTRAAETSPGGKVIRWALCSISSISSPGLLEKPR